MVLANPTLLLGPYVRSGALKTAKNQAVWTGRHLVFFQSCWHARNT